MEVHKRILSILFIISGVIQITVLLFISTFMSLIMPMLVEEAGADAQWIFEWLLPVLKTISWVVISLFSVPSIIGGIGLWNNKDWALTLILVLGCFKLFSFPIGTAIGVYAIWVYSQSKKEASSGNQ